MLDYEKEKYESHCAVFIDQGPTKIFKMHFKLCLLRIEGSDLATQFKFLFKYQKESGEELAIEKKRVVSKNRYCVYSFFRVPDQVAHRRTGQRLTKEVQNYSNGKHVNHIGLNCRSTTIS